MSLRIETERLILRPMLIGDLEDLFEYQSNPEIVRYIPWPPRTVAQVEAAALKTIETGKFNLLESNDYIVLVWEFMGLISKEHKTSNIGWVTHQGFQRQGHAFEATKSLLDYAFKNLDLHRVIADIDMRVPESAYLAEKLGMRREGSFIEGKFFKGEWCNMWLYAILKREFHA